MKNASKWRGLRPDQAVGLDWSELKPLEKRASAQILGDNFNICVSFFNEGGSPLLR